MFHAVQLILTIDVIREFVMSLQVMIYAKQNGAQMATFAATGTSVNCESLLSDVNQKQLQIVFRNTHMNLALVS